MSIQTQDSNSPDQTAVNTLYRGLLESWNQRSAEGFAASFVEDGDVVGFDGSQMKGQAEIRSTLGQIFADHPTGAYVGKVRDVRFLTPDVAVLRAIVGMIPAGRTDLEPKLNAVQTLIASRQESGWCIVLFQNTPAQLHGRPDLVDQMTAELRALVP